MSNGLKFYHSRTFLDACRPERNTAKPFEELSEAQHGYFTRAQAETVGVRDVQLSRAADYGQIRRLGHGVYRIVGAGFDDHADLRIAWLRLDPKRRARERTKNPNIWVFHQSAAVLLGLGGFIPPAHQFISKVRKQLRSDAVHVQVRPEGLNPDQWVARDGMATTSPLKTLVDLDAANHTAHARAGTPRPDRRRLESMTVPHRYSTATALHEAIKVRAASEAKLGRHVFDGSISGTWNPSGLEWD